MIEIGFQCWKLSALIDPKKMTKKIILSGQNIANKNVLYDRRFVFFLFPANVILIQNQDCLFRLRSEVKDSANSPLFFSSRTTQKEKKEKLKKTSECDYVRKVWQNVR